MIGKLTNSTRAEELTVGFLYPKDWKGNVTFWVHPGGYRSLFEDDEVTPVKDVRQLLENHRAVAVVQPLFGKGDQTRKVKNPREFAGYTLGFNDSLFVRRTHDLLTAIRFVLDDDHGAKELDLVAHPGAAAVGAAAFMLSPKTFNRVAIDTGGFRFSDLLDYRDPNFLPGGAKYGDVPMMVALGKANGVLFDPDQEKNRSSLVDWLLIP